MKNVPGFSAYNTLYRTESSYQPARSGAAPGRAILAQQFRTFPIGAIGAIGGGGALAATACKCPCCQEVAGHLVCCGGSALTA
jgi:hypothetical protein